MFRDIMSGKGKEEKNPVTLGDDGVLHLSGTWTVEHAVSLKAKLQEQLDSRGPESVDLSGIDWIDTAGLQLLLAAALFARDEAGALHIRGGNPDVQRALRVSGVADALESQGVTVDFNSEV